MKWRITGLLGMTFLAILGTLYAISNPGRAELRGTGDAAWWSIVAVSVAVIAPGLESEVKEKAEYQRQKRLLREIVLRAEVLLQAVAQIGADQQAAGAYFAHVSIPKWQSVRDSLAAYPVTGLQSAQEVEDLMTVRAVLSEVVHLQERGLTGALAYHAATNRMRQVWERDEPAFSRLTQTISLGIT
jgi:hypothetical protein